MKKSVRTLTIIIVAILVSGIASGSYVHYHQMDETQLADAKTGAREQISQLEHKQYFNEDWAVIKVYRTQLRLALRNVRTVDEVRNLLDTFNSRVAKYEKKIDYVAKKIDKLKSYLDNDNYYTEEQSQIANIIKTYKKKMEKARSRDSVAKLIAKCKSRLDGVLVKSAKDIKVAEEKAAEEARKAEEEKAKEEAEKDEDTNSDDKDSTDNSKSTDADKNSNNNGGSPSKPKPETNKPSGGNSGNKVDNGSSGGSSSGDNGGTTTDEGGTVTDDNGGATTEDDGGTSSEDEVVE